MKQFDAAKSRLAPVLHASARAELARSMADTVVGAAGSLDRVVATDHNEVAEWAASRGCRVISTDGLDLNGSIEHAVEILAAEGYDRVIIAHADLPFAQRLDQFATAGPNEVVLVSDRRRDGTNVLSVPTGRAFEFCFGAGSADAHRRSARRAGLAVRTVEDERLAWDVDVPEDLHPPAHLGTLPLDLDAAAR